MLNLSKKEKAAKRKVENELMDSILVILNKWKGQDRLNTDGASYYHKDNWEQIMEYKLRKFPNRSRMRANITNRLIADGLITDKYPNNITEKGVLFIEDGGYEKYDHERKIDFKLKEKSLQKLTYDKISFWLSIIAIAISLTALFKNTLMRLWIELMSK